MADEDDDISLTGFKDAAVESFETALEADPADNDAEEPRDAWWLRWLKFGSVIALPAIVVGFGFMFADYIGQAQSGSYLERSRAAQRVEHDTAGWMKFRFWTGAAVGGGLGLIYVARCIIRKTDP